MKSYELHTLKDGKWKIDSVYDNVETAMHEAKRAKSTERYTTIRLVEEEHDEAKNTTSTRTLFLTDGGKIPSEVAKPSNSNKGVATRNDDKTEGGQWKSKPPPPKKKSTNISRVLLTLGLIILVGVGVLVGLEFLYQAY